MSRSLSEQVRLWTVANNFKTNFTPKQEPKISVALWMRVAKIDKGMATVHRGKKSHSIPNKDLRNTYTNSRGISQVTLKPELALQVL